MTLGEILLLQARNRVTYQKLHRGAPTMSIQDCLELPDLLSKLPEVGYSIMNKGLNLMARAAHIQEQIKYLDEDLASLLEEVSYLWNDEERKEVGL